MLHLKNTFGLCSAVIGLLICFYFKTMITAQKNLNIINDKIYDGQLITLGDYSIEGKIKKA